MPSPRNISSWHPVHLCRCLQHYARISLRRRKNQKQNRSWCWYGLVLIPQILCKKERDHIWIHLMIFQTNSSSVHPGILEPILNPHFNHGKSSRGCFSGWAVNAKSLVVMNSGRNVVETKINKHTSHLVILRFHECSIMNHVMLPLSAMIEKDTYIYIYTVTEFTPAAPAANQSSPRLSSFQRMPSQLHQVVAWPQMSDKFYMDAETTASNKAW